MSSSQHPVALDLERQVGSATRLLATVMALPLVDGIFPALVLAGALSGPVDVLQIGLLVFGGSATLAVILAEMDGHPHDHLPSIAGLGVVLVVVAAAEAALAPTIASFLDLVIFERFAALVIAAVAAKTASATIGDYLPRPAIIIGLGMIASFDPSGGQFVTMLDTALIAKAAAAAGVGAAFALCIAFFAPTLRTVLDIDRFRFGSAVALGVLPLSILELVPGKAPLAVLVVTGLLAFDPGTAIEGDAARADGTITDGGQDDEEADTSADLYGHVQEQERDREPWL